MEHAVVMAQDHCFQRDPPTHITMTRINRRFSTLELGVSLLQGEYAL